MNNQKVANQIFKDYPGENEAHITEDGQAFFNDRAAKNHAKRMGFEDPEVFFRDGFEPEDTKALQEELELVKEERDTLEVVLTVVEFATDLSQEAPEINQETNSAIAAVVQLRDKLIASDFQLERVAKAIDANNPIPEETSETTAIEKAVISLRKELQDKVEVYQSAQKMQTLITDLSNELATLKAEKVDVVDSVEVKTKAKAEVKK